MKVIRFVRHHVARNGAGYNPGDVAGFPDDEAAEIVGREVATYQRAPATLEELEAEVMSRGYSRKAAKKIARERFDGLHGEEARYLSPDAERDSVNTEVTEDAEGDPGESQPSLLSDTQADAEN